MREIVLNGLCLLLALVCAWHVEDRRLEVRLAAALLVANWAIYIAAWSPVPPASLFWSLGLHVRSEDLWIVADALCGALILALGSDRGWGWALWALYAAQCFFHVLRDLGALGFGGYSFALNQLFLGQVAVFVFIGGKCVGDRVVRARAVRGLVHNIVEKAAWR